MKVLILLISTILTVLLYTQFNYVNKSNYNLETIEVQNPNKASFEKIIDMRQPCLFNNVSELFNQLQEYSIESINNLDQETKTELNNTLKSYFEYYTVPICSSSNFDILLEKKGTTTSLKKQSAFRLLISQFKGTKTIILFSPKSQNNLYPDNNKKKSTIDIWDTDLESLENIKNENYLEIILYPGNMLYIPYKWWYATINNEDSYSIYHTCESVFSNLLKI